MVSVDSIFTKSVAGSNSFPMIVGSSSQETINNPARKKIAGVIKKDFIGAFLDPSECRVL
jgi:hypothetical protein